MLPPFMAYYGVYSHNVSMVREAFRQIKLYRQILLDPKHHALRHIEGGNWQETSLWGTGNAWSANGETAIVR
jgi:rhamnogalacturonyl hydrolase YesR